MYGISMRENREIPRSPVRCDDRAGRSGNAEAVSLDERSREVGQARSTCEAAEQGRAARRRRRWREGGWPRGTRPAKRVPDTEPGRRAQCAGSCARSGSEGTRKRGSPRCCTTSTVDRLRAAYRAISPKAAPGVDGVTWAGLRAGPGGEPSGPARAGPRRALPGEAVTAGRTSRRRTGGSGRSASPRWRTRSSSGPSSRCSTPSTRWTSSASPMGSGRGAARIDALDALAVGIERKKVNWVLDADIRDFFTSFDHRWLMKFLEHRIADKRVLRLIGNGWPQGSSRTGNGRRRWTGHRREHRCRRCSRTCTCTTSSTCGSTWWRRHAGAR